MFIHQTFLLAFLLFFKNVFGDTPANCTYEDIQGSWLFYVGDNSHDNTLQCDESFKVVRKLRVELLFPDIVMDNEGNKGFWTMIYNQGFEVVVNGVKYFAFSKYEKSSTKSISYCNKTLPGWAHDATVVSKNWGCFYGKCSVGVLLSSITRKLRVRNNPSPVSGFLSFPKYPRERFENANICIPPTFQETVGSHLNPSLPVVATCMATLNQFNSNIFSGFSKQYSTCKNITIHYYTHIL